MPVSRQSISALMLLTESESWASSEETLALPLAAIGYDEWNSTRTERCLDAIKNGIELPPIKVVRLVVNGDEYYSLSDGNHRCIAMERSGRVDILSTVGGTYSINPDRFVIYQNCLWQLNGRHLNLISEDLGSELKSELVRFGVEEKVRS